MVRENIHIGTVGFHFKDWLGNFFPNFCPEKDFLRFYASQLGSVEVDRTFQRPVSAGTIDNWNKCTSDSFIFSLRLPRDVTISNNGVTRQEAAEEFIALASRLGPKLGPLKLQFSSRFGPDHCDVLTEILDALPQDHRFVVELHNPDCYTERIYKLLARRGVSLCLVDLPNLPRVSVQTGDFTYIRLGGDKKKIDCDFSYERDPREKDLQHWTSVIRESADSGQDVYVYCDNYFSGHAPSTVHRLRDLLESA